MFRENPNINKHNIFDKNFHLTAYADDTTFFVSDIASVNEIIKSFDVFSKYSDLKLNKSKCEICGIGVKNNAPVALCGFKNVILADDSIRVLGIHLDKL